MQIDRLSLTNFRNYARLEFSPPANAPAVLVGDNAQGKTSILEAIWYLATSSSPYTASDRQLIHWRAEADPIPFARLEAHLNGGDSRYHKLEMTLLLDKSSGATRFKKSIKLNHVEKRAADVVGLFHVVLFLPRDLSLVEGAPADRRRFMNAALRQVDRAYLHALAEYDKLLPQRNALLKRIADKRAAAVELEYWDERMADCGSRIIACRASFLRDLDSKARATHHALSGAAETLSLAYQPSIPLADETPNSQLAFDAPGLDLNQDFALADIKARFIAALVSRRAESIARGMSVVGPHRDELRLLINGRDCGLYGSRGQARTAVMALKFAEMEWMRDQIGSYPLFLLDEVVAELDIKRRAWLAERLDGMTQTLLTTTDLDVFSAEFLRRACVFRVEGGSVAPLSPDPAQVK